MDRAAGPHRAGGGGADHGGGGPAGGGTPARLRQSPPRGRSGSALPDRIRRPPALPADRGRSRPGPAHGHLGGDGGAGAASPLRAHGGGGDPGGGGGPLPGGGAHRVLLRPSRLPAGCTGRHGGVVRRPALDLDLGHGGGRSGGHHRVRAVRLPLPVAPGGGAAGALASRVGRPVPGNRSSDPTTRSASGGNPNTPSERAMEKWAWSEAYTRRRSSAPARGGAGPDRASAHARRAPTSAR